MSRAYRLNVEISKFNPDLEDSIIEACQEEWSFEDNFDSYDLSTGREIVARGEDHLHSRVSEDEIALQIAIAVWLANKGYCLVKVVATCLEELPGTTYMKDDQAYKEWKKR